MPPSSARSPESLTRPEKKAELYQLYRRARHLDKKWAVGCSKPDGFTILGMVPLFGDAMSTSLAIGYLRRIRSTFTLPEQVQKEMAENIATHVGISIIPMAGWILRRLYGVNRRNYLLLEKYVMSLDSAKERPGSSASLSEDRPSSDDRQSGSTRVLTHTSQ
ncbi:hypothetical protein GGF46_000864 [Coemansia sp. RSA 552]|nr:hypothetical protein GGF46_000864 [Coemansia sp. RSA 552]